MNKLVRFSLSFVCLLFISLKVSAQYKELLEPQYDWEIAALKKNHILAEQLYLLDEKGKKIHFQNRVYNANGQMVLSYDAGQRRYYVYDNKGRMTSYLDSTKKGDVWNVSEYHMTYDNDGRLKTLTSKDFSSTFSFDKEHNILHEKKMRGDTVSEAAYYYNSSGMLTEAIAYDEHGERIAHELYWFGEKGRKNKEAKTIYGSSAHDSTLTVYQYNDDNVMTGKMVFAFMEMMLGEEDKPNAAKTRATHYEVSNYTYKYDGKGRLIGDLMTSKQNPLSQHTFLYTYDDRGLRIKESYRRGKVDPHVIIREYIVNTRN